MLTALRKSRREMCTAPARGAQPVHCRPNSDPRSCDARCATDGVAACERGNYRPNAQLCQARGAKQPRESSGCTHPGCIRVAGTRAAVVLVPSTKVAALAAAVVVVDQDAPTWQRVLQRRSNSSNNANGTLTSGAEIPPRSRRDRAERQAETSAPGNCSVAPPTRTARARCCRGRPHARSTSASSTLLPIICATRARCASSEPSRH